MGNMTYDSLGWLIAGLVCVVSGIIVYSALPSKGAFYIELGIIALFISMVAVRVKSTVMKVLHKKSSAPARRRRRR
ncbi:MAG: hypothetical protein KGH59_00460 [Candidatus Micrarchaeota archaeon]|nr:hypothetical protein [Candidatus Micrarchaeota archaeon]MDE1804245.1 hypothetical protein [Candidatus Micrarchaeota archaeon]